MEKIILPSEFKSLVSEVLEPSDLLAFEESYQQNPETCIRLNPEKCQFLDDSQIKSKASHSQSVFVLKERPLFVGDPGWHSGCYYVQEYNSTRIGEVVKYLLGLNPTDGAVILDLCGAPGGKSTHISSVIGSDDLLIANEVIQSRNPILVENLSKWGKGNFVVTRADAKDFNRVKNTFSIVNADMPCSGEGMFRKDPKSIHEWSLSNVNLCAARQERIAEDIWPSLQEGGYFIYSTCTFNKRENEENVNNICKKLGGELVALPIYIVNDSVSIEPNTYRFYPHLTRGEGFFIAVIRKKSTASTGQRFEENRPIKRKKESKNKGIAIPEILSEHWIGSMDKNEDVSILHRGKWMENHPQLMDQLPNKTSIGIPLGLYKKNLWKPSAAFDLLINKPSIYPRIWISLEESIQYYQREFLSKPIENKGIVGLTWNGISLGTGNAVGHGINNLWPNPWRILQKNTVPKTLLRINASA